MKWIDKVHDIKGITKADVMKWAGTTYRSKHVRRGIAAVIVMSAIGTGGSYAYHVQKEAARAELIRQQASEQHMTLISEDEAKDIAIKAIGKDAGDVYFTETKLKNKAKNKHHARHTTNDTTTNGTETAFRPVYDFECYVGMVEYEIHIDAVTGQVLKLEVDD